jgi:hypothetical protein
MVRRIRTVVRSSKALNMHAIKLTRLVLTAALFGVAAGGAAQAADPDADAARQQRMDEALGHYRDQQGGSAARPDDYRNPQPGPAARAEASIKRGAHRAGHAIRHGAEKAGHAVGKGVRKTGEAIGRGGEKLEDAARPKP